MGVEQNWEILAPRVPKRFETWYGSRHRDIEDVKWKLVGVFHSSS